MLKYRLNAYSNLILLIGCFVLLITGQFIIAAAVFVVRYFLFGFVTAAYLFSMLRKPRLSDFFFKITFLKTLLPYFRALYYWIKSVNIATQQEEIEKALYYAESVHVSSLYTYNNQASFLAFLASLYSDAGNHEKRLQYARKAMEIPHRSQLDALLIQLLDSPAEEQPDKIER